MANKGPKNTPRSQPRVITFGKLLLTVIMLTFIIGSTIAGTVIVNFITPLGLLLIGRALFQIGAAQYNNQKKAYVLGSTLAEGIYLAYPEVGKDPVQRQQIQKIVNKRYRDFHRFLGALKKLPVYQNDPKNFGRKVVIATEKWLKLQKYDVNRPIHANVPIYGVSLAETLQTVKSLTSQINPLQKIWLVLNDPKNDEVRYGLPEYIEQYKADAQREYEQSTKSLLDRRTLELKLNLFEFIDAKEPNKRKAMAIAWLAQLGVRKDQLNSVLEQIEKEPNKPLDLKAPKGQISLNVDSDTIADEWATFLTKLSFILFDLSGLTSNVRIKNIDEAQGFWNRALASWTYFRYDYANNVERAAESAFNNVVCMSGPWMAIDTSTIPLFLGRFVNYTFQGVFIKPGDDRKVTYELNLLKLFTGYCSWIITYTDAPTTWDRWRKQQDRWTMSMYANFFTSVKELQLFKLHWWSTLDQLYAAGFMFIILGVLFRLVLHSVFLGLTAGTGAVVDLLQPYLIIFLIVNFGRGIYSAVDNRDFEGFIWCSSYILVIGKELVGIKTKRLTNIADRNQQWQGRAPITSGK